MKDLPRRKKAIRSSGGGTVVEAGQGPRTADEDDALQTQRERARMTSAEAERRFVDAVLAARYSQQQMEILRSAVIVDGDAPAEMEAALRELTPEHIEAAVRWLVQNNPGIFEAGSSGPFQLSLGTGPVVSEMVPLPVRSLGVVAGEDE